MDEGKHTNDGDIVLWSLELPESNINGDTTLTLGLEFVKNPCVLERTLAQLGGFLWRELALCRTKCVCCVEEWKSCDCVEASKQGGGESIKSCDAVLVVVLWWQWSCVDVAHRRPCGWSGLWRQVRGCRLFFTPPRILKNVKGGAAITMMRGKTRRDRCAYLLELLDGTLVNSTALVNQVTCISGKFVLRGGGRWRNGRGLPVVVDFPESTWPMTTTLMCIFSLLRWGEKLADCPLRYLPSRDRCCWGRRRS